MTHSDSATIPKSIQGKTDFWEFVYLQLDGLLSGQRSWVSNLSNTASLVFNALQDSPIHSSKPTNWVGFYVRSSLYPIPRIRINQPSLQADEQPEELLLGPFCGKPACQSINISADKARGVCADAFLNKQTLLVPNVDDYPGHIACDGDTKSELVIPLILGGEAVGVFDLDNTELSGLDEEDQRGLEKIAQLVVNSCDW